MQMLREGRIQNWKEMESALVREAMGVEEQDDDHVSEGGGGIREEDADEEEDGNDGGAERHGGQGRISSRRRGTINAVKVADIEMPDTVKKEGWKVVRAGMDKANVVIKEELTDGWVV